MFYVKLPFIKDRVWIASGSSIDPITQHNNLSDWAIRLMGIWVVDWNPMEDRERENKRGKEKEGGGKEGGPDSDWPEAAPMTWLTSRGAGSC